MECLIWQVQHGEKTKEIFFRAVSVHIVQTIGTTSHCICILRVTPLMGHPKHIFVRENLSKHARDWKSPTFRRNTPQPTPVHYQWEINSPPTSHLTPHQKFSLSRWHLELIGSNYRTKPINTSMIWSKTRKQSRKLWVQHHPPPQSQGYISVRQVFITTGTASLDISFTYQNKNSSFTSSYNTITSVALQHDTTLILSVNGIHPHAKQQPGFHMLGRELRFDVTNPFKRLSTLWTRCPKVKHPALYLDTNTKQEDKQTIVAHGAQRLCGI